MVQSFKDLIQCVKSLKLERDHQVLQVTMKRRVYSFTAESVLGEYSTVLEEISPNDVKMPPKM